MADESSALLLVTTTAAAPRRDVDGRVTVGGITHEYHLFIPSSERASRPMPLVLLFHGGGGDAANIEETTQMRATAERHGFLLVRPEGYDAPWECGNEVAALKAAIASPHSEKTTTLKPECGR